MAVSRPLSRLSIPFHLKPLTSGFSRAAEEYQPGGPADVEKPVAAMAGKTGAFPGPTPAVETRGGVKPRRQAASA